MSKKPSVSPGKKMSLGAQKEQKAEMKRRKEIQIKISRSEKNMKIFYGVIKKMLDKADEEKIAP